MAQNFISLVDSQSPPFSLFSYDGGASFDIGSSYKPNEVLGSSFKDYHNPRFSIIRFRHNSDWVRSYDLYVSPAGGIWKMDRYESSSSKIQIIGGRHAQIDQINDANGNLESYIYGISDRSIMPSIGLDTTYGIENGDSNRVLIRTNYGYSAGGLSNSYPINNYQGIGSGAGFLHTDFVDYPQWNQGTQTAFFKSRPFPWIFYPDSLDLSSIKFVSDYPYYSDKAKLVELIIDSLMNVELEVAIRIQPDGTIQYSWRWTSLGNFDWLSYATDSIWFALDRTMSVNGRLEYYYLSTSSFQAVYNSAGLGLTADSLLNAKKYAACFFDSVRPDFGLGFHYGDIQTQGGASISLWPGASNDSGSVQIVATNMFPAFSYPGNLFRQNFFNFGYLAEIDSKYELLKNYLAFLSNT